VLTRGGLKDEQNAGMKNSACQRGTPSPPEEKRAEGAHGDKRKYRILHTVESGVFPRRQIEGGPQAGIQVERHGTVHVDNAPAAALAFETERIAQPEVDQPAAVGARVV
jgi:hypothetical protein